MDRGTKTWSLQDAKARFSEVVDRAEEGQEQVITRHGKQVAKVVPIKAVAVSSDGESLVDFMNRSPLRGSGLKILPRGKVSLKNREIKF
jgi:prevent-host-death family protein